MPRAGPETGADGTERPR